MAPPPRNWVAVPLTPPCEETISETKDPLSGGDGPDTQELTQRRLMTVMKQQSNVTDDDCGKNSDESVFRSHLNCWSQGSRGRGREEEGVRVRASGLAEEGGWRARVWGWARAWGGRMARGRFSGLGGVGTGSVGGGPGLAGERVTDAERPNPPTRNGAKTGGSLPGFRRGQVRRHLRLAWLLTAGAWAASLATACQGCPSKGEEGGVWGREGVEDREVGWSTPGARLLEQLITPRCNERLAAMTTLTPRMMKTWGRGRC